VLYEDVVLEHGDLGQVLPLSDDHLASYRLAPGQELRLAQDRWPSAAGFSALPPPLALRFHPGRTVDPGDLLAASLPAWLADPYDHVSRVVRGGGYVLAPAAAATAAPALAIPVAFTLTRGVLGRVAFSPIGVAQGFFNVDLGSFDLIGLAIIIGRRGILATTSATPATSTPPATPSLILSGLPRLIRVLARSRVFGGSIGEGIGERLLAGDINGCLLRGDLGRRLFGGNLHRWLPCRDLRGWLLRWDLGRR
jgi:hypothetical protein